MSGNNWAGYSSEEIKSKWVISVSRGVSLCGYISKIDRRRKLKEGIKYTHDINSSLPIRRKDDQALAILGGLNV